MSTNLTKCIKGFADLFAPQSTMYTLMENTARSLFGLYGYTELRTPLMEHTELFCRGIGTETDVVQKEMYTFPDRKDRSLTLRPEATAGVMRAYIQNSIHNKEQVSKYFTCGPMFRYERPQKGRMRQFHQLNCECLGAKGPYTDAEIIVMLEVFLQSIGINDTELHINTLGCPQCRPQYRNALFAYLNQLDPQALCEDCRRRKDTNPMRVLDCKVPTCKEHTEKAPHISDHVCEECREHFSTVLSLLDEVGMDYTRNHRLVRGLDYYCRTTFEVLSGRVGAQSSIAGGGRYDGLVEQLGGPAVPGIGFACGMERLAMLMPEMKRHRLDFFIVSMGDAAQNFAFKVALELRNAGFEGEINHTGAGFKSQMRLAGKSEARLALIIGDDECFTKSVMVKHMDSGQQENVKFTELVEHMQKKLSEESIILQ